MKHYDSLTTLYGKYEFPYGTVSFPYGTVSFPYGSHAQQVMVARDRAA
jgi:hypothetical protein